MPKPHTKPLKAICMLLALTLVFALWGAAAPLSPEVTAADNQTSIPYDLFINGSQISGANAYHINNTVYIPASVIGSQLKNSGVTVDMAGKRLVIDLIKQNILLPDAGLTAFVKANAPTISVPGRTINESLYIPLNPIQSFFKVQYSVAPGAVQINAAPDQVSFAQINKNAAALPALLSFLTPAEEEAYVNGGFAGSAALPLTLSANDAVTILNTYNNYYKAELTNGTQAYIAKSDVTISSVNLAGVDFYAPKKTKFTPNGSLSINWEYVNLAQSGATPAAPSGKLAGLDVLCPVWFAFTDANANVKNVGDKGYTDAAHAMGYKVWATVTNSFDGPMSTAVLGNKSLRDKAIAQFLFYSLLYDVDGINIDFEGVKDADGPNLTAFVAEMRAQTEKLGLSLSIDVMVPRSWNIEYEYAKLHNYVDYIALMSYDEFYAGSAKPGPVASLPWVEDSVNRILKEGVPSGKVLLGVPSYTRIWTVDASDKALKTSSSSMANIRGVIAQKGIAPVWLEDMKLYYATYTDGADTKKVWLEDARSVSHKLSLISKYKLAGAATWRRGFEEPAVWDVYAGMLKAGQSADIYQRPY